MFVVVGEVVIQVVRLHGDPNVHLVVGHLQQLLDVFARPGGDGDHRYAQFLGQPVHVDLVPVLFHLVHKIEGNDHRPLQLQQLSSQIEVALNVGGVNDVDDGVGPLSHDKIPGHDLLHGVGGEGVNAGQIHHGDGFPIYLRPALLLLHRHAGPVAHILVGAGKGIKEGGLAAVGVAHQGQLHLPGVVAGVIRHTTVGRSLMGVVGVHPAQGLLVGHMLHHAHALPAGLGPPLPLLAGGDEDLGGVGLPQGQLVAPQVELHRVAEGGHLAHHDLGTGGQAHVNQAALHRPPVIAYLENDALFPGLDFLQSLMCLCLL